ncbi:MAG TPA: hypothetical protein PKK26_12870 [Candidatus Wallbacteria bacterium]|nr:hypothetical protein [Candidatus Wallbacteria bacterium]
MATQKKQPEAPPQAPPKPKEEGKPKPSPAISKQIKVPRPGLTQTFFTWILIAFLSFIFTSLLVVIVILFDFLGIINVRDLLPKSVVENPYVKDYIRDANMIKTSEKNQLKSLIKEQDSSYKELSDKLKHQEVTVEEKIVKLSMWEKELRDRELDLIQKETALAKQVNEFEEQKKLKIGADQALDQFSKVYERMDPQLAADALSKIDDEMLIKIFTKMKEKKSAAILEKMPADKITKLTERIQMLPKRSAGDTSEVETASASTNEVGANKP